MHLNTHCKLLNICIRIPKSGYPKMLDDCCTVLRSSQISPEELLLILKSISTAQFTMEHSKDQITFLDILDTQRCLLFTFSHSNQCKRTIPFCLAQRICTIAENNATKLKNLENLKSNLLKYNYLDLLIKQGLQKSLSVPQKDIRKPKKLSNANILQA